MLYKLKQPKPLTLEFHEEAKRLETVAGCFLTLMRQSQPLQATASSHSLNLTGDLIGILNGETPLSRQLHDLKCRLDTTNPHSSQSESKPLEGLSRPHFQLFVKCSQDPIFSFL